MTFWQQMVTYRRHNKVHAITRALLDGAVMDSEAYDVEEEATLEGTIFIECHLLDQGLAQLLHPRQRADFHRGKCGVDQALDAS